MAYEVGDLDVSRAAALIASACRKDDLGLAHHAAEAHDEQRCALLTFSVVECFADLLGQQFYENEEVAQHFSKIAAHHRSKYEEQMKALASQQDSNTHDEGETEE